MAALTTAPQGLLKRPSALLPLALSLSALSIVLFHVALATETVHPVDEGAAAHLWQLLIAAQLPSILFFVIRWFPCAPKQTLQVVALQTGAVFVNFAVLYFSGVG